jgi:hypothetical protein
LLALFVFEGAISPASAEFFAPFVPAAHILADAFSKMAGSLLDSPNFHGWERLLSAVQAEVRGEWQTSLAVLESNIESLGDLPSLVLGLSLERAGRVARRWLKSKRIASMYYTSAGEVFTLFGAHAKATRMADADGLRPLPRRLNLPPTTDPADKSSSIGTHSTPSSSAGLASSLDLSTLLAAISTWQRSTDTSSVTASLLRMCAVAALPHPTLIRPRSIQASGARYGCVSFTGSDRELCINAAGTGQYPHQFGTL